jgi:cytochrome b pre-mRNA-processing protein 3
MVFGFWRKSRTQQQRNQEVIERLHDMMVQAVRQPAFYQSMGVADHFEGRFDLQILHAFLLTRRLTHLPAPAADIAQDLTDLMFARLDAVLREMGVGDLAVPKRIKKMAEAYLGRRAVYEAALTGNDEHALSIALARNVLGREQSDDHSRALAAYVRAAVKALAAADLLAFESGQVILPSPQDFVV